LPEAVSRALLSLRGDAGANDPVFASRKTGAQLTERAVLGIVKRAAASLYAPWVGHLGWASFRPIKTTAAPAEPCPNLAFSNQSAQRGGAPKTDPMTAAASSPEVWVGHHHQAYDSIPI